MLEGLRLLHLVGGLGLCGGLLRGLGGLISGIAAVVVAGFGFAVGVLDAHRLDLVARQLTRNGDSRKY